MIKYKLPYWISNNGDGSASIRIEKTIEEAQKQDEEQSEGWGESCYGTIDIVMKDGIPHHEHAEWNGKTKKYEYSLVPLL